VSPVHNVPLKGGCLGGCERVTCCEHEASQSLKAARLRRRILVNPAHAQHSADDLVSSGYQPYFDRMERVESFDKLHNRLYRSRQRCLAASPPALPSACQTSTARTTAAGRTFIGALPIKRFALSTGITRFGLLASQRPPGARARSWAMT
jgi:hypothetical protein